MQRLLNLISKLKSKNNRVIVAIGIGLILLVGLIIYIVNNRPLDFTFSYSKDLSKGTLVLNTDKQIYSKGEAVLFQMATLDPQGDTLCKSNLKLEIWESAKKPPTVISTADKNLITTSTCQEDNNVTNEPDYIARFSPPHSGKYKIRLTNLKTKQQVNSYFEVTEKVSPITIERQGATRINPFKSDRYPVILRLTAQKDYQGELVETIPANFKIKWLGNAKVTPPSPEVRRGAGGEVQTLTWQVDLKAGETKEFAYEYQAPEKSPDIIELGPAKISILSAVEGHPWLVASDAITRGATVTTWTTSDINTGPDTNFSHTVDSNTTLLILVVSMEADHSISTTPIWNGSETMTLIRASTSSGSAADVRNYIYGLVNPTATTANITWTQTSNDNGHGTAVNYLGTLTSSVADATEYVNETVNNGGTQTTDISSGGTSGNTLFAAAIFWGGDGDPASNTEGFAELANSATGTHINADHSFYVADKIGGAPSGIIVDWTGTASDENAGQLIEILPMLAFNVSGTFHGTSESGGDPGQCDGSTANLSLRVNGGTAITTYCADTSGDFTFSNVFAGAGNTITIYSTGVDKANRVYVSDGSADTGMNLYEDAVIVADEQDGTVTNADLGDYDNGGTPGANDMLFDVSGSAITVDSGKELHIWTGDTYAPGGNVTTPKLHVVGNYTGSTETLTFTGSGTGTSRPLYVNGGTFTAPTTTDFEGTSATDIEATTFNALTFTPTITGAITYTLLGAETINGNFTINPTAATTQLLTVNAGGTITVGAGYTTTITGTTSGTSTLDLRPSSTDYNLSTGLLDIATAGTLDATGAASTITLTGTSGTLFTRSGTFTAGSSTVVFNPDAAVTLTSGTFQTSNAFYNLSLTPSISTAGRTYTFGSGSIDITSDFTIQPSGTQLLTVNMAGNMLITDTLSITRSSTATSALATGASNPSLSAGDINIATGGTLTGASSTSTITLTENGTPFVVTGTFTPGSTTINYQPSLTSGVTVTSTTYYNVTVNKASNTFSLTTSGIVVTNDLTITAGVLDTVNTQNYPITVGRNWTNSVGTAGFEARQGTVTFNTTTTAEITGTTTFYNFTCTTAAKTIKFGDTTTFTIGGLFTLTGAANPNYVTLNSVTGGSTTWSIKHLGTENITYTSVTNGACDSSTSIDMTGTGNYDGGNNQSCWYFSAPVTPTPTYAPIPVSYWKFDEGTGSTAYDGNSSWANHLTTTDTTYLTESSCVSGKCLSFNGTTSFASKTYDNDTEIAPGTGSFIVTGWFNHPSTSVTSQQTILARYNAGGYKIYMKSGGTVCFGIDSDSTWTPSHEICSTIAYNDSTWHHFGAEKLAGANWILLYIDGRKINTTTITDTNSLSGTSPTFYLGVDSTGNSNFWTGQLDEIRYYHYAALDSFFATDMAARGSIRGVSARFGGTEGKNSPSLSDGLVGHWKMDESSGNISDSSGNSHTLTNNGTTTFLTGKFGNGSEHVPASTQYFSFAAGDVNSFYFNDVAPTDPNNVWTGDANAFDGSTVTAATSTTYGSISSNYLMGEGTNASGSNSISSVRARIFGNSSGNGGCWVSGLIYTDGLAQELGGYQTDESGLSAWSDYSSNLSTPTDGWTWTKLQALETKVFAGTDGGCPSASASVRKIELEVSEVGSSLGNVSSVSFWTNPDSNTNSYLSLTSSAYITSTSGTLSASGFTNAKIYVNGVQNTTIAANSWQHVTVTFDTINSDQFYIGRQGNNYYDGTLDEVRVYNRTLSPAEVEKLYNLAPGPVGYWKLDEGTGNSVSDSSANERNATWTGSNPHWATGKYGTAGNFVTRNSDYIQATQTLATSYPITLSAWVKTTYTANPQVVISLNQNVANQSHIYLQIRETNGIARAYCGNTTAIAQSTTSVNDGNWHHITGVFHSSTSRDIYVDGKFEGSNTESCDFNTSINQWTIGMNSSSDGTKNGSVGAIDEVRVYNYARTPKQIVEDMNAGHPAGGSPVGSYVGYWKFDEGGLNTCSGGVNDFCDNSINGNDLAFSTTTGGYSTAGKYGMGLNATGSVWATRADDPDFDFAATEDLSISTWIYATAANKPSSGNVQYLYTKGTITSTGTVGYALWTTSGGNAVFGIRSTDGNWVATAPAAPTAEDSVTSTTDLYDSTWHHIVATKTGTSRIDLYIDGRLQASDTSLTATATLVNSIASRFADRDAVDNGDEFIGVLDEFKIYRLVLSPSEVLIDYAQNSASVLGGGSTTSAGNVASNSFDRSYCVPGDTTSCSAPVAEWKMDEARWTANCTTTSVLDSSGNGFHGAACGSTKTATGKYGNAASFNQSLNTDYIKITDSGTSALDVTAFTITGWFNRGPRDAAGRRVIISKGRHDASPYRNYFIEINATNYISAVYENSSGTDSSELLSTTQIAEGQWYHFSFTVDGSRNSSLYINGVREAFFAQAITPTTNNNFISIGDYDNTGYNFDGKIDHVRIYNYARSSAQVAWDYNQGKPAHWLKMDECQGTTLNDSMNSSTTVTLTIGGSGTQSAVGTCTTADTAWGNGVYGKFNSSLNFDGVDDTSALTTLPNQINAPLSLSMWLYPTAGGPTVQIPVTTAYGTAGEARVETWDSWATMTVNVPSCGTGATATLPSNFVGNWHHIVRTYEAGTVKTYLDGRLFNSHAYSGCTPLAKQIRLSYQAWDPDDYYRGQMDEVQIYTYALTPNQVQNIYNQNSALRFGP